MQIEKKLSEVRPAAIVIMAVSASLLYIGIDFVLTKLSVLEKTIIPESIKLLTVATISYLIISGIYLIYGAIKKSASYAFQDTELWLGLSLIIFSLFYSFQFNPVFPDIALEYASLFFLASTTIFYFDIDDSVLSKRKMLVGLSIIFIDFSIISLNLFDLNIEMFKISMLWLIVMNIETRKEYRKGKIFVRFGALVFLISSFVSHDVFHIVSYTGVVFIVAGCLILSLSKTGQGTALDSITDLPLINHGIAIFDKKSRLISANDHLRKITGFTSLDKVKESIESNSWVKAKFADTGYSDTIIYQGHNNNYYRIDSKTANGLTVFFFENVSDLWRSEQHKSSMIEDLGEKLEARTEWVARIAHEIKSPLYAISTTIDSIKYLEKKDDMSAALDELDDVVDSLLAQADSVLDFSSINNDTMTLNKSIKSPGEVIEKACKASLIRSRKKNLEFIIEIEEKAYELFEFDERKVLKVVGNLVWNAVKYTERGFIHVEAWAFRNGFVSIRVSDTGRGVPEAESETIFTKYNQGNNINYLVEEHGGIGLGLPIAREIARVMGGDIRLLETGSKGACFEFTFFAGMSIGLPDNLFGEKTILALGSKEELGELKKHFAREKNIHYVNDFFVFDTLSGSGPDIVFFNPSLCKNFNFLSMPDNPVFICLNEGYGDLPRINTPFMKTDILSILRKGKIEENIGENKIKKVLIVEDDRIIRQSTIRYLKSNGWRNIDYAIDGLDGLQKMNETKYDLIMTDYHMPKMSGFEMMSEVYLPDTSKSESSVNTNTPCIMMTADAETGIIRKCRDIGIEYFLAKPARLSEVLNEVEHILSGQKQPVFERNMENRMPDNIIFDKEILEEIFPEKSLEAAREGLTAFKERLSYIYSHNFEDRNEMFDYGHTTKNRIACLGFIELGKFMDGLCLKIKNEGQDITRQWLLNEEAYLEELFITSEKILEESFKRTSEE